MRSKVQKWGNSLALRVPKSFADEMGLEENSSVELMLKEGLLIVSPAGEQRWKLEELLAGVTEENIHHEWEIGG
jgi:antitoxin MazE